MRSIAIGFVALAGLFISSTDVSGQSPRSALTMSVPRLVNVSGEFRPSDGSAPFSLETVTLRVYSQQSGGVPLWQETQTVTVDQYGFYTVVLGATEKEGIPLHVFGSSEAQWLGLTWSRAGEVEGARARLTSVPYALRAADAETLGGLPSSAFQLAPAFASRATPQGNVAGQGTIAGPEAPTGSAPAAAAATTANITPKAVNAGTTYYVAKYVTPTDVGNSTIYELNGLVGFNTTTPQDVIHSRFTNSDGMLTGLAVQNLGSGASSYSGMLFYDQNGALGQFQGFNNSTHEYRVNNVASSGSISFMLAGTPYLKVDSSNKVLIGTTTSGNNGLFASGVLEVLKPASGAPSNAIFVRRGVTDTFTSAIHARSDVGISGPLIQGVAGLADNTNYGGNVAIQGVNLNANGIGIDARGPGTNGVGLTASGVNFAAQFAGNVSVSGTLTKGGGAFKIDHPLDPEHKYLMHSFVESPDMMNVYNGNAILDAQGGAVIVMPDWFEALNRDFRYHLTAIGAPGPNLYIADEMAGNQFRIAGGAPGGKVSWQVTGIRHDPWADANRIPTDVAKSPVEAGMYLHPKAYRMPAEKGIDSRGDVVTSSQHAAPN